MTNTTSIVAEKTSIKDKTLHIYVRVSTEGQVDNHSIEAQTKAGMLKAQSLGMKYQVHKELGASAKHDNLDNRPVLKGLLELCDDGKVTAIFITELDRLTRSPIAMYLIKKVLTENGVLLYTTSQTLDLRDEETEFISSLVALLSQRENSIKSKRSKRGLREAAQKKRWIGIIHPYGYKKSEDKTLVVNESEADIYKEMVDMCFAGVGTTTIARRLNARSVATRCSTALKNGTKVRNKYTGEVRQVKGSDFIWKAGTVYSILTNPIYCGKRRYKGETFPFPAIIDEDTFNNVQLQLKKNKHNGECNTKHFYLLKGMLRCGHCGRNLYGRLRLSGKDSYYMCSSKREKSCGCRSLSIKRLDALIWGVVSANDIVIETIREELSKTAGAARKTQLEKIIKAKQKELDALSQRRENLLTLFEVGKLTAEELDKRLEKIQAETTLVRTELSAAQNEMAIIKKNAELVKATKDDAYVKKLMKTWDEYQKRQFLKNKHVDVVLHWHPETWSHTVEITFDSGFEVRNLHAPNAPVPPKPKAGDDDENNGSSQVETNNDKKRSTEAPQELVHTMTPSGRL